MFNIYFKEMKKFFSLIALVGVLAACQPEKLETTFEVSNAKAVINVKTIEISTGKEVTCTLTSSAGTVAGNVITIEGNPAIAATTVTVTAKYQGADYTGTVNVDALIAEASATYGLQILVGVIPSDYKFKLDAVAGTPKVTYAYASITDHTGASHSASHSHDNQDWFYNMSEFILELNNVTVKGNVGVAVIATSVKYNTEAEALKQVVDTYVAGVNQGYKEVTFKESYKVSAWAMYNVKATRTEVVTDYTVLASKDGKTYDKIGTFQSRDLTKATVEKQEKAIPGHSHDYVHGHGHDSHGSNNAGGGIIFAD